MTKHVIFDLWYTLIYLENSWKTFNILKEDFNVPADIWIKKIKQLFLCKNYTDEGKFLQDFSAALSIDVDIPKYSRLMASQRNYDLNHISIYPDAIRALEKTKEKGYKIGIISNQCSFYEPWFYDSSISKFIDIAIFSNKFGFQKPQKEIYDAYLNAAHVNSEDCMMVGDNLEQDYLIPKALGMKSVLLDRTAQRKEGIVSLDELFSAIE